MKPTIVDVAKKAKVSSGAASEIINSKRHYKFSETTVARVMKAAEELGYNPNYFAKSLRTRRTGMIGMVCKSRKELGAFYEPYITDVYQGVGAFLSERNLHLIFKQLPELGEDSETLDMAETRLVDGFIVLLYSTSIKDFVERYKEQLIKMQMPVVMVHSMNREYGLPGVGVNCRTAGRIAAEHLAGHGYGSIGIARTTWHPHIEEFRKGYADALEKAGMKADPAFDFVADSLGTTYGIRLAEQILAEKRKLPRAIAFADDTLAFGFIKTMQKAGISVPDDVAVTGFGDWIHQEYYLSDLTSAQQPGRAKGLAAATMLADMIGGKKTETTVIVEPELTVRTSCGCR